VPQRLPRGRHGLSREAIARNQRSRLIAAIVEVVGEHGYGATKIAQITAAASVSRRSFYQQFANKEACFEAAHEVILGELREAIEVARGAESEWPAQVRAGLSALLEALAARRQEARFFLIASLAAGDQIAARHHRAMAELIKALVAGAPADTETAGGERALAGSVSGLIVARLNEGEELAELAPALSELVLRGYARGEG
jgi:AcrR family transcriptional regulator